MIDSTVVHQGMLAAVRDFVRNELCHKNHLEPDAFPMSQRVLTSRGEPCAYYFCIHGPRSVRLTAVWDLQKKAVLFYDSLGRRSAVESIPVCQ